MFVLLHSTRHNEAMTGNDEIYVLYFMVNLVYFSGEYISPQPEQIGCVGFLDRSTSNHNVYSWHLRSCFSDNLRFPDASRTFLNSSI